MYGLKKKKKGSLVFGDALIFGMFLIVSLILLNSFGAWYTNFNRSQNVKHAVREYVERMETVGYLTASDENSLRQTLTGYGVNDLTIESDTTKDYVGYGNQITLHIKGNINKKTYLFDGSSLSASAITADDSGKNKIPIDITKTSTCKMVTGP